MPYALRLLSREGVEAWLREDGGARAPVAFATRAAAVARQRQLLDELAADVLGIDVVPYPPEEVHDAG